MHICFLSTYLPQPCGIATYTHYLAEALAANRYRTKITILGERPARTLTGTPLDVVEAFDHNGDYPRELLQLIRDIRPDVLHVQHEYGIFGYDERFPSLLSGVRTLGIPTVLTLHTVHTRLSFNLGCSPRRDPYQRLPRARIEEYQARICKEASLVLAHQENTMRQVLLRQGLRSDQVATVPHGTRLAEGLDSQVAKTALGIDPDSPLILAFGYFERSKNLLRLVQAFEEVKKRVPTARLWLGGYQRHTNPLTSAYRSRVLAYVEQHGLSQDVHFASEPVAEQQVPQLFAAADVAAFVYDEDTRSSSGALHLALGAGRAVVGARIPKFEELSRVSDEILVNPRSVSELARALVRILIDESFREYVQARVRTFAAETSWQRVASQHIDIYQRLQPTARAVLNTGLAQAWPVYHAGKESALYLE